MEAKTMTTQRRRITKADINAVGYPKLAIAAMLGLPIGALLGYVFAVVWRAVLPAGDIIFLMCPVIGAFGGLLNAPVILIRRRMSKPESPREVV